MTENDPDPYEPDEARRASVLGGRKVPDSGDPTDGGKRGQLGEAPSITSDEPDDGSSFPVGGGSVEEERTAPPVPDRGPDA